MRTRLLTASVSILAALVTAPAALSAPGPLQPDTAEATGTVRPQVVGGAAASTAQFPWVVALTTANGRQFCGGTLVSATKVLTAAHCTFGEQPAQLRVVAGRTDLRRSDGVQAAVTAIWVHPQYRSPILGTSRGPDVSVLTLDRSLPYRPLRFATPADSELYAAGTRASVYGWGRTSESGPQSSQLRAAEVPVMADPDCAAAYPRFDPRSMLCAGRPDGGVDACQGDSGGPLVAGGRVIGVTSWGTGCARPGQPGVYTRVAAYADLLADQIRG